MRECQMATDRDASKGCPGEGPREWLLYSPGEREGHPKGAVLQDHRMGRMRSPRACARVVGLKISANHAANFRPTKVTRITASTGPNPIPKSKASLIQSREQS